MTSFQEWVEELIATRFGTATAVAAALDMQLSPFTRGVKAGTLNLVNLLKLAKLAEEHPSKVLRLAGKAAEADLLEALYGGPSRDGLSPSQREIIATWELIPKDVRGHFAVLLRHARDIAVHAPGRNAPVPETRRPRRRGASRSKSAARS